MAHADPARRFRVRGETVSGGKMLRFGVEGNNAPVGFERDPPAITARFQIAEMLRVGEFAFAEFDAGLRGFAAFTLRVFDVNMDDFVGDAREIVADRVFVAFEVKAVAGIPDDAELR